MRNNGARERPARSDGALPSPYVELDRAAWARLRENHPLSLDAADLARLRGLGERIDLDEVEEVYLPLSRLLNFYVGATAGCTAITSDFLGERPAKTPFVIGVAGSVAVGKSTTARILQGAAVPLARHAPGRAGHDRRVPLPQRRARAPRTCCSARAFPSPTTGARCCGSSPR